MNKTQYRVAVVLFICLAGHAWADDLPRTISIRDFRPEYPDFTSPGGPGGSLGSSNINTSETIVISPDISYFSQYGQLSLTSDGLSISADNALRGGDASLPGFVDVSGDFDVIGGALQSSQLSLIGSQLGDTYLDTHLLGNLLSFGIEENLLHWAFETTGGDLADTFGDFFLLTFAAGEFDYSLPFSWVAGSDFSPSLLSDLANIPDGDVETLSGRLLVAPATYTGTSDFPSAPTPSAAWLLALGLAGLWPRFKRE